MDPLNRNKKDLRIPKDEIEALKHLIKLQKDRVIVIKAADKGAGIVILDFEDYMKNWYKYLLSSLPKEITIEKQELYYKPVNEMALEKAKEKN